VITLDCTHQIIGVHIATVGLINRTIIHPREVFIHAVRDMASSIAIAHNHPSGNIIPSSEDEKITMRIKEASDIMGFYFLDHLIFSKNNFYSFRREHNIFRDHVV
jgi:DNA repair protein RadC